MAKEVLRKFSIGKRVRVWASVEIKATSLEDALDKAEKLRISDFIRVPNHVDVIDWKFLDGTSISEDWDD